jgi:P pilus assembly chaperone PapD
VPPPVALKAGITMIRPLLVLVLLAVGAAWAPRRAAADVTVSASPSLVDLRASPGATGSQEIVVRNDGADPFAVTVEIAPYQGVTGERAMLDWLTATPGAFSLEPGQQQAVTVDIAVPDDLDSGGRYAMVTFATGAVGSEGSGVGIAGRLGVAFLLVVEGHGDLTRSVAVDRFGPVLEADGRVSFQARLRNEGNVHVAPVGTIELRAVDGTPYGALELPQTTPVLPDSTVDVVAQGSLPLESDATYTAEATIDYGGDEPLRTETEFAVRASLALGEVGVCENLDRGPTLHAAFQNDGDLGLTPLARFAIRDTNGQEVDAGPIPPALLWPGEAQVIQTDHSTRLVSGDYTLIVEVRYGAAPLVRHEVPFRIGGTPEGAAPICGA